MEKFIVILFLIIYFILPLIKKILDALSSGDSYSFEVEQINKKYTTYETDWDRFIKKKKKKKSKKKEEKKAYKEIYDVLENINVPPVTSEKYKIPEVKKPSLKRKDKLEELIFNNTKYNNLQKAIIISEIFCKPKGLE